MADTDIWLTSQHGMQLDYVKTIVKKFLLSKNQYRKILEILYKTGVSDVNFGWTHTVAEHYSPLIISIEKVDILQNL